MTLVLRAGPPVPRGFCYIPGKSGLSGKPGIAHFAMMAAPVTNSAFGIFAKAMRDNPYARFRCAPDGLQVAIEDFGKTPEALDATQSIEVYRGGYGTTLNPFAADRAWITRVVPGPEHDDIAPEWAQSDQPRTFVNWFMASAFAVWAGRQIAPDMHFRLPTAAEWEHAATGGNLFARFGTDTGTLEEREGSPSGFNAHFGAEYPAAVHSYPPNPYGLYDMGGNVGEWCHSPSQYPRCVAVRGAWHSVAMPDDYPLWMPLATQACHREPHIGFRCVMSFPETQADVLVDPPHTEPHTSFPIIAEDIDAIDWNRFVEDLLPKS